MNKASFTPVHINVKISHSAWCLRSEGVSSVLLGVSNTDQLLENLGAMRVTHIHTLR